MSLKGIAQENLAFFEAGLYRTRSGTSVVFREAVERAVRGTVLYRPEDLAARTLPAAAASLARIEVTSETSGRAAHRLHQEGVGNPLILNFASAKNPGGGFLGGAKAQEEDLARCSALYPCLLSQHAYYDANRAEDSLLYTDHIVYSPRVPFFRDDDYELLDVPFEASIVTAPAPNAGEFLRQKPGDTAAVRETLVRRALLVLSVATQHRHRTLVLGAWGCGVFRNAPEQVADAFARALEQLPGCFERIVFAVYERSHSDTGREDGPNRAAFRKQFGGG